MNTKKGPEPIGKLPKWDFNRRVNVSEWDIDQGNNRIYNISRTYEREFKELVKDQPPENVKIFEDFLKRMKFEGISVVRRLNYIRALKLLEGSPRTLDRRQVDLFLDKISRYSVGTVRIRFYCLKKFLDFLGKGDLLKGIKPPSEKEIKVRASDLLTREDLQKLLEATYTARRRAFVMMLYESGARIGELLNIELRDLEFDSDGVLVYLEGKTGRRRIRLVESASYLRKWVNEIKRTHPNTPYLWFGVSDKEPSQYAAVVKFLKQTAKRAGLRKKIYPHLFRHSRASELAQKLKESQLRAFMGWDAASDMPRVYIHLSAQDLDKAILDLYKQENCAQESKPALDEITKFYEFWKKFKAVG